MSFRSTGIVPGKANVKRDIRRRVGADAPGAPSIDKDEIWLGQSPAARSFRGASGTIDHIVSRDSVPSILPSLYEWRTAPVA
jgi:hypothetical protein